MLSSFLLPKEVFSLLKDSPNNRVECLGLVLQNGFHFHHTRGLKIEVYSFDVAVPLGLQAGSLAEEYHHDPHQGSYYHVGPLAERVERAPYEYCNHGPPEDPCCEEGMVRVNESG